MSLYGHCGKNCSDKGLDKAIQCDLCAAWVHASCEGVSSDDYKLMKNLTSSSKNVIYYCSLNQCLSRVKQIVFLTQLLMHHLIFLVPLVNTWIETDENQILLYIYGLPEASASIGLEHQSCYLNSIQELVHSELNISLETTKCFCLGRRSSKPRPLLISPTEISTRRLIDQYTVGLE